MITGNSPAMGKVPIPSSVILVASTFANHDEWPPVLRALDAILRTQWPDKTGPESLARVEARILSPGADRDNIAADRAEGPLTDAPRAHGNRGWSRAHLSRRRVGDR